MTYLLIKSLHVCAIVAWMAGMVLQSLLLHLTHTAPAAQLQTLQLLRRWDRFATTPAMLLAWLTGLFLATQGAWFGDRWLSLKLVIVIALTAMHGILAGRTRALAESRSPRSVPPLGVLVSALFAMIAGIVSLVIVKPF